MTHYIASADACLDFERLLYRSFAVIFHTEGSAHIIDAHRFADDTRHARQLVQADMPSIYYSEQEDEVALHLYQHIREQRQRADWQRTAYLSTRGAHRETWKVAELGWYVVRSDSSFPCYAAAIFRGRWRLQVVHRRVCENVQALDSFVREVATAQGVDLTVLEIIEPSVNPFAALN